MTQAQREVLEDQLQALFLEAEAKLRELTGAEVGRG